MIEVHHLLSAAIRMNCFTRFQELEVHQYFWSRQTPSILFLPIRYGLAIEVDGGPSLTHDFFVENSQSKSVFYRR